jgi:hypothetical protein
LNFSFFLFFDSLSFKLGFVLFLIFGSLIRNYWIFLIFFFFSSLFFFNQRLRIGFSSLLHQIINSLFFHFSCCQVFISHLFNVLKKLNSFLISYFLFFHSLNSSFLNLVNNNFGALLSSLMFSILSFLLFLKNFQSLNFHHQIKFLLFINPLLL